MMSVFFFFFFCNPYKHTHANRFQTSDFESQNNIFHKANKFCWLWIEYVAVKWTKWLKIQFVQRTSFRRIADQSLSFPSAMILIYIFRLKKAGDISLSFKRPPICFLKKDQNGIAFCITQQSVGNITTKNFFSLKQLTTSVVVLVTLFITRIIS